MTKIDADTDPQHYHQRISCQGKKVIRYQKGIAASDPMCQERSGLIHFRIRQQADATVTHFQATFRDIFMAWQNGHIFPV